MHSESTIYFLKLSGKGVRLFKEGQTLVQPLKEQPLIYGVYTAVMEDLIFAQGCYSR